jgi:uncharacterized protein DUF2786
MAQPQNWRDKIVKLIAKAESPAVTHAEREALLAAISRLMVKHGIDAATLAAADPSRLVSDPIEYVITEVTGVGPRKYGKEWVGMGIGVAEALGAKAFFNGYRDRQRLGVAAHRSDIERIIMLWKSLQVQATSELARFVAGYPTWSLYSPSDKYQIRRSFIVGYGREVASRLRALRRETIAEAQVSGDPGTDLAVRDRDAQVDDWVTATMKIGKARSRNYDASGAVAGHMAGQRADIGQATLNGGRRELVT